MMASLADRFGGTPQFWPAALVAVLISAAVAGVVGRLLRLSGWVVFGLLASLGLVIAATLTPAAVSFLPPGHAATCEVGSWAMPPLGQLVYVNEASLNVALFVPLGVAVMLLPRPLQVTAAALWAVTVPWGVEFIQYLVPSLNRVCSTADISANLLGLVVGFGFGLVSIRPLLLPFLPPALREEELRGAGPGERTR